MDLHKGLAFQLYQKAKTHLQWFHLFVQIFVRFQLMQCEILFVHQYFDMPHICAHICHLQTQAEQ